MQVRWRASAAHRELLDRFESTLARHPAARSRPVGRHPVAIARALQYDESGGLLVLDEPTAALPPTEVDALFEILMEIRSSGVGVLYVSHRLEEIQRLADRATVIARRSVAGDGRARRHDASGAIDLIIGHEPDTDIIATSGSDVSAAPLPAPESEPVLFRIENLTVNRLRGVSFIVPRGEIVGIAGLTGSGREVVAEAIVGAIPSDLVLEDVEAGRTYHAMNPRRGPGSGRRTRAPQSVAERRDRRVHRTREHDAPVARSLHAPRRAAEAPRNARGGSVDGVPRRPSTPTEHLFVYFSGGNQQKLIFAKWFAITPRLLLLDDPTSGVDVGARARLYQLIRDQAAAGIGVVLVSSDIEDLVSIATTVHVIARGVVGETLRGAAINESSIIGSLNRSAERTLSSAHESPGVS